MASEESEHNRQVAGVRLTTARLECLSDYLQEQVAARRVAGVSALVEQTDGVHWRQDFGYADLKQKRLVDEPTLFRIFSLSKPITATAVLLLHDRGRLSLSDKVADYLPEFSALKVYSARGETALSCPVTVMDLLCHTAGFGYGNDPSHPVDAQYRSANLLDGDETLAGFVERLCELPLKFQPGTAWEYSLSYDVLGRLIEVVSGQSFDAFLQRELFEPLCMHNTWFAVPEREQPRLASLYTEELAPTDNASICCRVPAGGQGLVSTITDYRRFLQLLRGGGSIEGQQLLSPITVAMMLSNHLSVEQRQALWIPGYGYGLGVGVLTDHSEQQPGHLGEYSWAGNACCYFWVDPQTQTMALLFSQTISLERNSLPRQFKALLYQALL